MIARLRGTLVLIDDSGDVIVECGGVGYSVAVSSATAHALPDLGAEVTLRIYTQAQENKIALFGFATDEERELFNKLITVKNVGPQTAIEILSGGSATELARTIADGDVLALTKIRGVGKKRAELLVVELREKCTQLLASWKVPHVTKRKDRQILDDVVSALVNLGYRAAEADKAVALLDTTNGATLETLLREALRVMPR